MNKKILEALKNITQKDIDKIAEDFLRQQKEEDARLHAFLTGVRFPRIWNQLKLLLENQEAVSDNPYQEPLFGDVSNQEFTDLFLVAFNLDLSQATKEEEDPENPFANESVVWRGLRFFKVHGQGTAYFVQKINPVSK